MTYRRIFLRVCKVLIILDLLWVFAFGKPQYLLSAISGAAEGIFQGVVYGLDSDCDNGWTCDGPNDKTRWWGQ